MSGPRGEALKRAGAPAVPTIARRVLVVDDESGIRRVLRGYLERDGFAVTEAVDGRSALDAVRDSGDHVPDVVLLDVGLPDLDGFEVLRQLRTFSEVFVLLVTARVEEVDRLVGLGIGADDYITKPFSPREVVARVKTVLRRERTRSPNGREGDRLEFPGLMLDAVRREVTRDGTPVELSALEFDLLAALMAAPGRVFTRRQVLERVWGNDWYGDERVVDVHVRSLRAKLGDPAGDPDYIGTVRGVGYKFLQDTG